MQNSFVDYCEEFSESSQSATCGKVGVYNENIDAANGQPSNACCRRCYEDGTQCVGISIAGSKCWLHETDAAYSHIQKNTSFF